MSRRRQRASQWLAGQFLLRSAVLAIVWWCLAALPPAQAAGPSKTVIVLVDLSDSTDAKAVRERYLTDFRTILDHLSAGDILLVSRILKSPSSGESLPVRVVLKDGSWSDNPRKAQLEKATRLTCGLLAFEKLLDTVDKETPLFDVLAKVPDWFKTFPRERRVVVLLSDMREYSAATANFEAKAGWSATALDATLARLKKNSLIPDLAGVRIYVAGAIDKDELRLRAVKGFWQRYFESAHADFATNRYDTNLVKFDECQGRDGCPANFFRGHGESELRKAISARPAVCP